MPSSSAAFVFEPLLRRIRNEMLEAGLVVENSKGECNFGQHEIGFLYADALTTADNHSVYKTVAKEIASQQGRSVTFMAKWNYRGKRQLGALPALDGLPSQGGPVPEAGWREAWERIFGRGSHVL